AIWDFDAHHGNGTEDIVANNPGIALVSIHQFPGYPGTGTRSFGNIHNFQVGPFTPRSDHVDEVRRAFHKLVELKPDLLLVSAGRRKLLTYSAGFALSAARHRRRAYQPARRLSCFPPLAWAWRRR